MTRISGRNKLKEEEFTLSYGFISFLSAEQGKKGPKKHLSVEAGPLITQEKTEGIGPEPRV